VKLVGEPIRGERTTPQLVGVGTGHCPLGKWAAMSNWRPEPDLQSYTVQDDVTSAKSSIPIWRLKSWSIVSYVLHVR